jgi:AraC family transcriptional regulator
MPEAQPLTVDFIQANDVLQVLPDLPIRTSDSLGWNGIYVQQHHQPAWETPEYTHIRHMLIVHSPDVTTQSERWFDGRMHQEQVGGDNTIIIVPAGVQHRANWNRDSPFSLLFLEPDRLIQIARESVTTERIQLLPHGAMQDPLIDQIGRALTAELGSSQIGSQLFVESLTIALAIHLLRQYSDHSQPLRNHTGGLPQRKLDQAIEYIHEHLGEDLSIAAIADALEMSQYYFARLFKQSLGSSPYQYVMQQRIQRAESLLKTTPLSIAAIAQRVGFSNQGQFTIQFRKFTGTTPSRYRRQL